MFVKLTDEQLKTVRRELMERKRHLEIILEESEGVNPICDDSLGDYIRNIDGALKAIVDLNCTLTAFDDLHLYY